jgi:hypothetical protein
MQPGPWRWIVLFFTRPIRLADLKATAGAFKPRPKSATLPVAEAEEPARRSPSGPRATTAAAVVRDAAADLAVSEQPLDTLPAELQSEFGISARAPLDRASPPVGTRGRADG